MIVPIRSILAFLKTYYRYIILLAIVQSIACCTLAQTVYVTRTGKKYHDDGCRYLSKSKISATLSDAKDKGYTACSVCKPSTTVETKDKKFAAPPSTIRKAVTTQCTGTIKSGRRCSRMTTNATGRCYQH
jgi:predicted chitinase